MIAVNRRKNSFFANIIIIQISYANFVSASNEKRLYVKSGSGDENEMENSLDIAEIDARLTALQKFMKSNMDDL